MTALGLRRGATDPSRTAYLAEVADLLWPAPQHWQLVVGRDADDPGDTGERYLVLPSADRPRLVVPAAPSLAAAAVRHGPAGGGRKARLSRRALELALRTGVGGRLVGDRLVVHGPRPDDEQSLAAYLDSLTGVAGAWSMPVTKARANRKPVIQVLGPTGRPVAFAKVGTNPLTRALVDAEGEALTHVAGRLGDARVPRVLGCRDLGPINVLVLAPLASPMSAAEPPRDRVLALAAQIAHVDGVRSASLTDHPYWSGLRARLDGGDERSQRLLETCAVLDGVPLPPLAWGAWHGDFAPWNLSWSGGAMTVWDFERFARGVPVGLDLVHYDLQTRILKPGSAPGDVIGDRFAAAAATLAPLGLGAVEARLVFTLYLVDIAARWIEDRQDRFGAQGRVLDALVDGAARTAVDVAAQLPTTQRGTP